MALTFQQIIQKLTQFWQSKGCIIHQGHDLEMGAGTFNPATFLRALGPEPYQAAYVEPSRRPSDGRYGDNPNRVQLFHQFQVLLKPSPEDVLESYLDSLRALGFDLKKHDIRFVHDDWESPTIGAWGLGWEVWCDGMEITQFTYFQAVASLPLSPISAEITYGLERLALFIQNKESIFDVLWDEKHTLREIIHHNEVEWSSYNFTHASTSMWLKHFEDYEKEAKDLVDQHLPIPAYDFIVKGSHAFNLLDARGAISVAERASYIGRIRELARLVGGEYIAKREALGFPLLPPKKEKKKQPLRIPTVRYNPKKSQDFLLEIGSEPLPATFVPIGCHQLQKGIEAFLKKHSLQPKNIHVFGTPERLSVLVTNLPEGTSSTSKQRKGPSLTAAFATTGTPTAQGAGFLKSVQQPPTITLAEIRANKVPGLFIEGDHLCALWEEKGVSSFALLAEHLPKIILGLDFPKKMQWTDPPITYARPIRWLVALFGERIIPFEIGNVRSGRLAKGHSQLCPKFFPISSPNRYLSSLRKHYVLADTEERKQSILKQLHQIEKKCKGVALSIEQVLPQVLHLTQWPRLTSATFDPSFLKIPKEILICEMVEHQKYFPIANTEGELKNTFIITADNAPNTLIRKGNQKVLSARLSDGAFLYKEDLQISLEKRNEQLQQMTHLKGLGSMWDKVCRLRTLSHLVNQHLQLADTPTLERSAKLCKADLASLLVREFPELQGNIGKYYALAQGETKQVASAIEEHWMPNAESAPLPHTPAGIILSIADKVDNLLSCYCMHLKPTSSSDPYALRRQGIGIIKILLQEKKSLDLNLLLLSALSSFPMAQGMENALVQEILPFLTARLKGVLEELGFRKDVIEATLHCPQDPYDQFRRTEALHTFCQSGPSWERLCEVYKRAKGQLSQVALASLNPTLATEPAEQALMKTLHILQSKWDDVLAKKDYLQALHLMAQLQPPLAHLFDSVKILADDPTIRANRIALLHQVFSYFTQLIDFQKIAL